jgi:hypothetical protein
VAWECAECNVDDRQNRIVGVCHHCGKPLCLNDRIMIADDAFAGFPGEADRVAVHCRACAGRYHLRGTSLGRRQ